MEAQNIYKKLEEDFKSTIVSELIPGIIHNFANPLNGIMGRAQIMSRRIQQLVALIEENHPDVMNHCGELLSRLIRDVEIMNDESERFHRMFEVVGTKFQYLHYPEEVTISLTDFLKTELSFAENYLKFKHQVVKEFTLEDDLPTLRTIPAFLSVCIWAILHNAIRDIEKTQDKKLKISTLREGNRVGLKVYYPFVSNGSLNNENADVGDDCLVPVKDIIKLLQLIGCNTSCRVEDGTQVVEIWFES
ncbi:MAG: hypothetical protein N2317_06150 [Syntrophales bacterium]|nr:hypothetical protein [Syntrophales bacterium]